MENRVSGKRARLGSRNCGAHEGYLPRILLQLQDEGVQFPGEVLLGVFHFFKATRLVPLAACSRALTLCPRVPVLRCG